MTKDLTRYLLYIYSQSLIRTKLCFFFFILVHVFDRCVDCECDSQTRRRSHWSRSSAHGACSSLLFGEMCVIVCSDILLRAESDHVQCLRAYIIMCNASCCSWKRPRDSRRKTKIASNASRWWAKVVSVFGCRCTGDQYCLSAMRQCLTHGGCEPMMIPRCSMIPLHDYFSSRCSTWTVMRVSIPPSLLCATAWLFSTFLMFIVCFAARFLITTAQEALDNSKEQLAPDMGLFTLSLNVQIKRLKE